MKPISKLIFSASPILTIPIVLISCNNNSRINPFIKTGLTSAIDAELNVEDILRPDLSDLFRADSLDYFQKIKWSDGKEREYESPLIWEDQPEVINDRKNKNKIWGLNEVKLMTLPLLKKPLKTFDTSILPESSDYKAIHNKLFGKNKILNIIRTFTNFINETWGSSSFIIEELMPKYNALWNVHNKAKPNDNKIDFEIEEDLKLLFWTGQSNLLKFWNIEDIRKYQNPNINLETQKELEENKENLEKFNDNFKLLYGKDYKIFSNQKAQKLIGVKDFFYGEFGLVNLLNDFNTSTIIKKWKTVLSSNQNLTGELDSIILDIIKFQEDLLLFFNGINVQEQLKDLTEFDWSKLENFNEKNLVIFETPILSLTNNLTNYKMFFNTIKVENIGKAQSENDFSIKTKLLYKFDPLITFKAFNQIELNVNDQKTITMRNIPFIRAISAFWTKQETLKKETVPLEEILSFYKIMSNTFGKSTRYVFSTWNNDDLITIEKNINKTIRKTESGLKNLKIIINHLQSQYQKIKNSGS